jgi:hypothetical protein
MRSVQIGQFITPSKIDDVLRHPVSRLENVVRPKAFKYLFMGENEPLNDVQP